MLQYAQTVTVATIARIVMKMPLRIDYFSKILPESPTGFNLN